MLAVAAPPRGLGVTSFSSRCGDEKIKTCFKGAAKDTGASVNRHVKEWDAPRMFLTRHVEQRFLCEHNATWKLAVDAKC